MNILSKLAVVVCALFFSGIMVLPSFSETPLRANDHWLLEATDDAEKFRRIEQMFGGFSAAMLVVGERYDRSYDAIAEGNLDLAEYHWKKIREAIELGYLRRPGRKANSVALFLNGPWQPLAAALAAKDTEKAKEAFLQARSACQACHIAEKVQFMNDQPRFRRTAVFAGR